MSFLVQQQVKKSDEIEISLYGTLFQFKQHPKNLNWFYSIGNDHDLSIWDIQTNKLVCKAKGTKTSLTDGTVSSNGDYVITASTDGTIIINYKQNQKHQFNLESGIIPLSVCLIEKETQNFLLIGTTSKDIQVYQINTDSEDVLEVRKNTDLQLRNEGVAWATGIHYHKQSNQIFVFQNEQIDIWTLEDLSFNYINSLLKQGNQGQILCHSLISLENDGIFISTGDSSGKVVNQIVYPDRIQVLGAHQMQSAILQIQILLDEQQNIQIVCGTLDKNLDIITARGEKLHSVIDRCAPFFVSEQNNTLIARCPTSTRKTKSDKY